MTHRSNHEELAYRISESRQLHHRNLDQHPKRGLSDLWIQDMNDAPAAIGGASRDLQDRFRSALEADDYAALRTLSIDLRGCPDIVPRSVCLSLGLPRGSTYALAATTIIGS